MTKIREVDGHVCVMDYNSPRITAEFYECGLPLTFDQYSKCAFNCQYCFSAFLNVGQMGAKAAKKAALSATQIAQLSKYRNPVRSVDPDKVKRFWTEADSSRWNNVAAMLVTLVRKRTPLHWGGLCDPFDPFEKRFKVGLELLMFFRALDYPVLFSTKGTLMTEGAWAETLAGGNFRFQFSIVSPDPAKSKVADSGVPGPAERLAAMRTVTRDMGLTATLRLRPIIPGIVSPEECLQLIEAAHDAGATGVSTEFFCLEQRAESALRQKYDRMSAAAGMDIYQFYKDNSPGQSGYLRLNRAVKAPYFLPMADLARKLGMRFSVSDMHFKELGTVSGCCGSYWNDESEAMHDGHAGVFISKGTITHAHILGKERGEVHWSDLAVDLDWGYIPLDRAHGIQGVTTVGKFEKHRNQTLAEVLRSWWNDPNNSKSPYRYGGGRLYPDRVDECGDVVYRYRSDEEMAAGIFPSPVMDGVSEGEVDDGPACASCVGSGARAEPVELISPGKLVRR